ncbi:MAG: FHA domain-containing protein [Polyangiaceae bacterium]|nr:FHA domain-containing protein [Polyangiaceae bacterium]
MICATCGHENPPHLIFCQACGKRLSPRIDLPAPPTGAGSAHPALAGDPVGAKVLSLATPFENISATKSPAQPPGVRCHACGMPNPAFANDVRFCTSCGAKRSDADPEPLHTTREGIAAEASGSIAPQPDFGRLVAIAKSGADGESFPLRDLLDIGRTDGEIVVAEDPYLSPRHVRIVRSGGKFVLRDLDSTNGVYLRLMPSRDMNAANAMSRKNEGEKVLSASGTSSCEVAVPLRDQDLILVGQQVLKFEVIPQSTVGYGPASEHGTLLFGSPASVRYARLSQRSVEGITLDVHYIQKMETVLGRESGDLVFTEDPFLSRRHAAVRLVEQDGSTLAAGAIPTQPISFALVDLGSSNGTFLRIRQDVDLRSGDHFRVGQQLFRVEFETDEHGEHGSETERS